MKLRVREHPVLGPYVEGLSQYVATSNDDIQKWIELGTRVRATAATGMNDKSSRSHSVFTIVLTQTQMIEHHETSKVSKINLIDLAGSERSSKAQTSGERLREGANINRSLHTLGKVISLLSESSMTIGRRKRVFVPYRDSVLTWLLKESLGGNSKTAMIATISPSLEHYEESLSTLRYAQQARSIVNVAKINEDAKAKLIRELKEEIERLRRLLGNNPTSMEEVFALREKLRDNEKLIDEHSRTWKERLADSERRLQDEFQKSHLSVKIDNRLPNLVNLNEDPQLSEMLLYILKEGVTSVGRAESELEHDIELAGALIEYNHCVLENNGTNVAVTSIGEAKTFVNGEMVDGSVTLRHGDRIVFGGDHYFRFNHPMPVRNSDRQELSKQLLAVKQGFEFARDELFQVQNARLEAEIEEARMKANEEALVEIQAAKEEAQKQLDEQKTDFEDQLKHLAKKMEVNTSALEEQERGRQVDRDKIAELEVTKQSLEDELVANKHLLYMHKLTTEKVEEERRAKQTRLIADLEAEKRKIEDDVAKLKMSKLQRERTKTVRGGKISNTSELNSLHAAYYHLSNEHFFR
ncbi:kinesin-like protein KIF14 isoform X2 [Corticium candelabrum]|uniref:kinesin-like protein KIF14 isoform X2 n=1 Tax=Corticium candelabrum TaxID=121492 RepID=UPI002E25470F|nr:kinesin-like protein KIF14 isoform X2 [Corticium candelabrum]